MAVKVEPAVMEVLVVMEEMELPMVYTRPAVGNGGNGGDAGSAGLGGFGGNPILSSSSVSIESSAGGTISFKEGTNGQIGLVGVPWG